MKQNKALIITVAVLIVVVIGLGSYLIFINSSENSAEIDFDSYSQNEETQSDDSQEREEDISFEDADVSITENGIDLRANYKGNNSWEYQINGQKPTPCYSSTTDVITQESLPETVNINLEISPPERDLACAQVVEEFSISGEFQASEEAEIKLNILES